MKRVDASRREFLRISSLLSVLGPAGAPFALNLAAVGAAAAQSADDYRALVCLFFFGGNDSHNMVLATDPDSWAEYQRLRGEFEKKAGHTVDDAALSRSIRIYNRNRQLLRELYAIRRDEPWKLSCTEGYLLLRARTRIPCEEHNALLEAALPLIRARDRAAQDKPRVVFVGGFCEQPPLEMLEAIDDACYVVEDDLLIGLRWITSDVPETGDPIRALAESFVDRSAASPVQHDERKSKEGYLMEMIESSRAEAAIVTAAKFCEPGLDEQVAWSKHLDEVGIQYLVLEFEEKMTSFEQMAMQLETFAESLLFSIA